MARVLENAPKDAGLEGVGVASLVTDIRVPETERCRNFSSGLSEDLPECVSFQPLGEVVSKEGLGEERVGDIMSEE